MKEGRVTRWLTIGANLAVLLGLIFVGLEVRTGRAAAEAQSLDGVYGGFLEWNLNLASDSTISRIWRQGLREPDGLTDSEVTRFSNLMRGLLNQFTRVHGLYRSGLVDEEYWALYARQVVTIASLEGGRQYLAGNELPADFLADLEPYRDDPARLDASLGRDPLR